MHVLVTAACALAWRFADAASDARLGGFVPAGVFVAAQIKRANPLLGGEERFARTEASGTLTPLPDECVEVSVSPAPATGWITEPWVATACP